VGGAGVQPRWRGERSSARVCCLTARSLGRQAKKEGDYQSFDFLVTLFPSDEYADNGFSTD